MNTKTLQHVAFLGIGGIGMSALARYFLKNGATVTGYDRTRTALTAALEREGAKIHFEDRTELVNRDAELVVYTPAVPSDMAELKWYLEEGYAVHKRSEVLQWMLEGMQTVAVAGTHGKTTVSTMIAYLLRQAGDGCNAFLGGVSVNYQTNYWKAENNLAVVEADEYDRSFLRLNPAIAVLTAMDADHLDIYGTAEALQQAFIDFTKKIQPEGALIYKHGLPATQLGCNQKFSYALQNDAAHFYAANIQLKAGGYAFDFISKSTRTEDLYLPIGGMHNLENAVAALAVLQLLEIPAGEAREALKNFKGVKRRFEYVLNTDAHTYIDDYAHHPEELRALIRSAKHLFPGRRCVVAFQPHLYSRTRDLATDFAHALDEADEVILMPIYPAREKPIPGVSTEMIAAQMGNPAHTILSPEGVLDYVRQAAPKLFLTAGAGDIDRLVPQIKSILQP